MRIRIKPLPDRLAPLAPLTVRFSVLHRSRRRFSARCRFFLGLGRPREQCIDARLSNDTCLSAHAMCAILARNQPYAFTRVSPLHRDEPTINCCFGHLARLQPV